MRRLILPLLIPAALAAQSSAGEWPNYHRDLASTRYSPLEQITRANVGTLGTAWTYKPDSLGAGEFKNENTPLMVAGKLYVTTGLRRSVVALDAATGTELWHYTPTESDVRFRSAPRKGAGRGVGYWSDGRTARIFTVTPGFYLVALDAGSGRPIETFGEHGIVDLKANLGVTGINLDSATIGNSSPPLVFENTVVIPPALLEGSRPTSMKNTPGRVMAFDAITGKLKWRFNTIPTKGEFGYDTWKDGSAEYTGNAGVWAPMSVDTKRGYIYLPVEGATGDYYGGHRPGDDLFSSSLVCLDIRTGKRVWHYQIVHHDIWDRDNPTAPILTDITVDGRKIEAVAQITKQNWVYVFDRVTGKPVWPIVEKPVPQTDVPGETSAPTQPHPTKPPAFDLQGITVNDLIDFTPSLRAAAIEAIKPFRLGQLWTPPSVIGAPDSTRGTISVPGSVGGANWEHGSFDPETQILYVGSFTNPSNFGLVRDSLRSDMRYVLGGGGLPSLGGGTPNIGGLPFFKPPYNRITAIDLNKGEIVWQVPGGDTPDNIKNHPALAGLTIPTTGARTRPAVMATKTLLFATEGYGSKPVLHVLDKKTGERVADIPLPGSVGGSPMSYMVNGKQYVAVWAGRQPQIPAQLVVLGLGAAPAPGAQGTDRPSRQQLAKTIDSLASDYVKNGPAASVQVLVIRGQDTISSTQGLAHLPTSRAADATTIYRIGSLTKQFTAAIIMQLAEQKKLSIDDSLGRYVKNIPAAWRPIPIRRLLNHTSGIHNYTDSREWATTWAKDMTPAQILTFVDKDTLDFAPGTKWSYSNTGYVLLGMVIEAVTGHAYAQEVDARLFAPLGMSRSGYCPSTPVNGDGVATGYSASPGGILPAPYLSMTHPYSAGALCMTTGDFAKWQRALASGKVVSADSYRLMTTPEVLASGAPNTYGFGLGVARVGTHRAITHSGGVHGFVTIGFLFPEDSTQVIAFSNTGSPGFGKLTQTLPRAALGMPLALAAVPLPDADRDRFVGQYDIQLPGRVLPWRAFVQNGALASQAEGQGVIPLKYLGNNTFGADFDPSLRITFVDEGGKIVRITLQQGGGTFPGPRRP